MSVQIGDEVTIINIATEFRNVLARIQVYMEKESEYNAAIEVLEKELLEEESLKEILDQNNVESFLEIRQLMDEFFAKTDLESKFQRLEEIYESLQATIEYNNNKLQNHQVVTQVMEGISMDKLNVADSIPQKIEAIQSFLASTGRLGNNQPVTVFSGFNASQPTQDFVYQIPNNKQFVRGYHSSHDHVDHQFYVAPDFVTLVQFNDLPMGATAVGDATLTIYADEPQTGVGTLQVYQMNDKNRTVSLYTSTNHTNSCIYNDDSRGKLTRTNIDKFTTDKLAEIHIPARAQNDPIEIMISQDQIQKYLDDEALPILVFTSDKYLRFDASRHLSQEESHQYMPKLFFKYK